MLRRVCVFCGSSDGAVPSYREAARRFGAALAGEGLGLVYGGGRVGIIGALAEGALAEDGEVIGVIPEVLQIKERAHHGLSELRVVGSLHERKALMGELSDAFVALPGGLGTLDELCEVLTLALLGLHEKPCGLLDVDGYFESFLAFLDRAARDGFVRGEHRARLQVDQSPEALLARLRRSIA